MEPSDADSGRARLSAKISSLTEAARSGGRSATDYTVANSKRAWSTPLGKTIITGVLAGGAIGAVVPLLSVFSGAVVGGAGLTLWRALKQKN